MTDPEFCEHNKEWSCCSECGCYCDTPDYKPGGIINGPASQTANLMEWQNSDGGIIASLDKNFMYTSTLPNDIEVRDRKGKMYLYVRAGKVGGPAITRLLCTVIVLAVLFGAIAGFIVGGVL